MPHSKNKKHRIKFIHIFVAAAFLVVLLNFVSAWLVSKVTAAPPEHIQHLVEDIRVPKGAGVAAEH